MDYSTSKNESLLSRDQASEYLGVCKTTLDRLKIPATRLRRRVFYRQSVLDKWLQEHTEKEARHG